jgi:hypothetical protein
LRMDHLCGSITATLGVRKARFTVHYGPIKRAISMIERGGKSRQMIERIGGASRDRTDDLIVANDALSQLSYSPTTGWICWLLTHFNSDLSSAPNAPGI